MRVRVPVSDPGGAGEAESAAADGSLAALVFTQPRSSCVVGK